MTELVNFRAALTRIGFNDATKKEIVDNGFDSISSLLLVSESEITELARHIGRWTDKSTPPTAGPGGNVVTIPFLSLRKLVAMRKWALVQEEKGKVPEAIDCTNQAIVRMIARLKFEASAKEAAENTQNTKPSKLKNLTSDWRRWWDALTANLEQDIGARGIPKIYLLREYDTVTPAMHTATYSDTNVEYVATFAMSGENYEADNKALFKDLKQQLIGTPAFPFLKEHQRTQDGRAALKAVKAQAEGQANVRQRKSEAYSMISTAKYRGHNKNFSFDDYIGKHHLGHAELAFLKEPVSESKKVEDFLLGILDSRLQNAKDTVLGDPVKAGNFEACQQYLKTVLLTLRQHDRRERTVSATEKTGGGGRKTTSTSDSEGPPDLPGFKPHGGTLAPGMWVKLSYKQRNEVKAIRADKKKAVEKKRKISAAAKEKEKEKDTESSDDAGSQFGRNAHKKGKKD